jgi:alkylhydroperoxidase family enzyme
MRVIAVLTLTFSVIASADQSAVAQPDKPPGQPLFPTVENDSAWTKLPRENPPLPPWARTLVGPLPKTTAKMLELDYLHRAKNPLGPELAGLLQWTVADALGSKFGKATAEADLRRAKYTGKLEKLGDKNGLAPDVQVAVAFARKLTLDGSTITDEEFAALLRLYGPEKVTAIVHTVAYANFHNRLILGIGAEGDPVSPVDVKFDPERLAKVPTPPRPPWDDLKALTADGLAVRVQWGKTTHEELCLALDRQKERKLRIPLPDPSRLADLPPKEKEGAATILWNTVSSGYQPEMPRAWFAALYTYYDEAKVDRVFTNSVFWVVTRTNDCFY